MGPDQTFPGRRGGRRNRPGRPGPDAAGGFPGSPGFPGGPFGGPRYRFDPPTGDDAFGDPPFGPGRSGRGGRGGHGHGPGSHAPGHGFDPGFGPGFGPGFRPGFGGRRGRGRGRARGDVRAAILVLLAEQPRHGYELIQEIAERSSGFWTPSPGSVYPTLQALEDEGLVTIASVDGRRTASLTGTGHAYVTEHADQLGEPWAGPSDLGPALAVRREALALRDAVGQVVRVGTPAQYAAAGAVLATARKELYRILAQDAEPEA